LSVPGKPLNILISLFLLTPPLTPYILAWGYPASSPRGLKKLYKKSKIIIISIIQLKVTGVLEI